MLFIQKVSNNAELVELALTFIGNRTRFKHNLVAYLSKYKAKMKEIVAPLYQYKLNNIQAVLVSNILGK